MNFRDIQTLVIKSASDHHIYSTRNRRNPSHETRVCISFLVVRFPFIVVAQGFESPDPSRAFLPKVNVDQGASLRAMWSQPRYVVKGPVKPVATVATADQVVALQNQLNVVANHLSTTIDKVQLSDHRRGPWPETKGGSGRRKGGAAGSRRGLSIVMLVYQRVSV